MTKTKSQKERRRQILEKKRGRSTSAKRLLAVNTGAATARTKTDRNPVPLGSLNAIVKAPKLQGSGGYSLGSAIKAAIPKGTFGSVGSAIGNSLGGSTGGMLGGLAGNVLSHIFGCGSYKVKKNSFVNGGAVPTFTAGNEEGMRVCHREYVGDITGSSAFSVSTVSGWEGILNTAYINPSNPFLFPWLSNQAVLYEEYEIHGLVVEYRPTSGTYAGSSSSAALGYVIAATDYNVANKGFSSKTEMDSYEFATSTVPFTSMLHPVECKSQTLLWKRFYTFPERRNFPPSANLSVTGGNAIGPVYGSGQNYCPGFIQIATGGMPSSYTVGELWVSYDISFYKPRLSPDIPKSYNSYESLTATATDRFGSTISNKNIYCPTLNVTFPTSNTMVIPHPGDFKVSIEWTGAGTSITAVSGVSTGANITAITELSSVSGTNHFLASGASASHTLYFTVSAYGTSTANTITYSGLTGMTTCQVNVIVMPYTVNP